MEKRFHIIVDAWNVDPILLDDPKLIEDTARKLVGLCDMKILHGPVVIQGVPENPGITCFTIIDFSHISIHTFTATKEICVDVFSCKKYDYEKVKKFVCDTFKIQPQFLKYLEVNYD